MRKPWLLVGAAQPARADIVYFGQDASFHWQVGFPNAAVMAANAVRFAANGVNDPTIAVIDGGGFGADPLGMLTSQGFTQITSIAPANLGTTNLSQFQVLYFAPTTSSVAVANYIASAANILAYANADGGLVVEPQVLAAGAWTWVPYAALIGHSGGNNGSGENINIVAPGHPVMAGISNADLSNWGISAHTTFATPGAAGFTTLAVDLDNGGIADIIALQVGGQAVPEPASLALCGIGLVSLGGYALRRRKAARG